MVDNFTVLNPGSAGDVMDESGVTYGSAPVLRKRPRVVLAGEQIGDTVQPINNQPTGSEYGIITRPVIGYPGTTANTFANVTLVPTSTETTVVSYTPTSQSFYFTGLVCSGNANARYNLYVNGSQILAGRSSVANLTIQMTYPISPIQVSAGQTIALKVIHEANVNCDFEGTILGYLI